MQLREKFNQADTDQGGALELEEFVAAFGDVIGEGLSNKELVQLFMRIDTNSDGSIDWDEFMNFIILENENMSHMKAEHCEYVNPKIADPTASQKWSGHSDMITKLLIVNPPDNSEPFKYFSASNDGTVKIWNGPNMVPLTNINVSKNWVTSIAYLNDCERIAAGTTERSINFYDLNKSNETISNPVSRISDFKGVPLTMDYISRKGILVVGDDQGYLRLYSLAENWHICNSKLECHKNELLQEQITEISKKKDKAAKNLKTHFSEGVNLLENNIHSSWITKVSYIPDIEGILTSSLDTKLKHFDIERKKIKNTFGHHKKGVLSFVYCPELKLVASCGEERKISLWDPYSKTVAMTFLNGHNSAVIDLALNQDKNQLISLGTDKVVKVWDIRTFQCVQTIADQTTYRPENRLTGLYFNPKINSLVLTSKKINIWPFKAAEELPTSHESTVTSILFNKNFSCIISGDEESNVHVWDINENKLTFKFMDAHNGNRITCVSLDSSGRRLITGSHDGSIKMWNFNNGQCLREFNYEHEPKEVSKLAFIGNDSSTKVQQIVSVGWDKCLYIWPDENEPIVSFSKCLPTHGHVGHTDDILSLTYCPREKLIVTGGQTGQIIAWHMETGFPKAYLHEIDKSLLTSGEGESKAVEDLLYSNLVNLLISVSADNLLRLWEMRDLTLKEVFNLANNNEMITCACLSPNEKLLILGDEAGNVRVIDYLPVPKCAILYHFNAHKTGISNVCLFTTEESQITLLMTTAVSRNIKIFTEKMKYLGYLGQSKTWNLGGEGINARPPKYSPVFFKGGQGKFGYQTKNENNKKRTQKDFKIPDKTNTNRYESLAGDVFRGIDIEKSKVEHIPMTLEESFRVKTGKELFVSLPWEKKKG